MTALGMILAGLGLTLVWCGIRDEDPRAVIAGVFTGHGTPPPGNVGRLGDQRPAAHNPGNVGRLGS